MSGLLSKEGGWILQRNFGQHSLPCPWLHEQDVATYSFMPCCGETMNDTPRSQFVISSIVITALCRYNASNLKQSYDSMCLYTSQGATVQVLSVY